MPSGDQFELLELISFFGEIPRAHGAFLENFVREKRSLIMLAYT
jgi:hypothetical protein